MSGTRRPFPYPRIRPACLAGLRENVLDPVQVIVDPHHHLWHARPDRNMLDDLAEDVGMRHDVRATAFIQCGSGYREDGPEEMRPVGETEFVAAVAAASETRDFRACAGIVGHADCRLGDRVDPVLLAHVAAVAAGSRAFVAVPPMTLESLPRYRLARRRDCSSIPAFAPGSRAPGNWD